MNQSKPTDKTEHESRQWEQKGRVTLNPVDGCGRLLSAAAVVGKTVVLQK
jgi:hypothetical protein